MKAIRPITSYPSEEEVLQLFNAYVRGPMRERLLNAIGSEVDIPWKLCAVSFLPLTFDALAVTLSCEGAPCFISAKREGYASTMLYILSNFLGFAIECWLGYPTIHPIMLRVLRAIRTNVSHHVLKIVLGAVCSVGVYVYVFVSTAAVIGFVMVSITRFSGTWCVASILGFTLLTMQASVLFLNRLKLPKSCRSLNSSEGWKRNKKAANTCLLQKHKCFCWFSGFEFTFTCWEFGSANKKAVRLQLQKIWSVDNHRKPKPFLGWRVRQLIMAESFCFFDIGTIWGWFHWPRRFTGSVATVPLGVDVLRWMKVFFWGKNHQVMKAYGTISVISGTVSLSDLWFFLILSEIQDRYMIQISQRAFKCCGAVPILSTMLFPCCPILFSLTTACAKSGYLVDLLNYLSFHEHPVNYTRGIYVYDCIRTYT